MTSEEQEVYNYISADDTTPINQIIRKTGLTAAKVISIATQLEIKGIIENTEGGYTKPR